MELYTYLPTVSNNKINTIINQIVDEHLEYEPFFVFLSSFALQSWAYNIRKNLNIDVSNLEKAIEDRKEYFGITVYSDSMNYQKKCLTLSKNIVQRLDKILTDKSLLNKEEIMLLSNVFYGNNKFQLSKTYLNDLKEIFIKLADKYSEEFEGYYIKLNEITDALDEETYITFHDAELLFLLSSKFALQKVFLYEANGDEVYAIMLGAIHSLESYPFEKDIEWVLMEKFKGKRDYAFKKEYGLSSDYVTKRYFDGIDAINAICWGFNIKF